MAPDVHKSGVACCLMKVSVEKVALPHGFVPMAPAFYYSCFPYYPVSSRTFSETFFYVFSITWDERDQALRKT